jgi:hypothetical protein
MATTEDTSGTKGSAEPAHEGTATPQPQEKRKKKYSRGLKTAQRFERGLSKGAHRFARATETALATWRKYSDRSARKKRDGAIRDAPLNYAKAVSRAAPEAARVLVDLAKGLPRLRLPRLFL